MLKHTFNPLASEKDYEETKAFFQGKNTSKYKMALEQALDTIKSRAAWVVVCISASTSLCHEYLRHGRTCAAFVR